MLNLHQTLPVWPSLKVHPTTLVRWNCWIRLSELRGTYKGHYKGPQVWRAAWEAIMQVWAGVRPPMRCTEVLHWKPWTSSLSQEQWLWAIFTSKYRAGSISLLRGAILAGRSCASKTLVHFLSPVTELHWQLSPSHPSPRRLLHSCLVVWPRAQMNVILCEWGTLAFSAYAITWFFPYASTCLLS